MKKPILFQTAVANVQLFLSESAVAPLVVVPMTAAQGAELFRQCSELSAPPFHFAALSGFDWNACLSPWAARIELGEDTLFKGCADEFLRTLTETLLPMLKSHVPSSEKTVLAGYSMAGLFALYAPYQTAAFDAVISCSGSVWYPGFEDFCRSHAFAKTPEALYLSLGDQESRTRQPLLATVGDTTLALANYYQSQGIPSYFEWNKGNHFKGALRRLAKGIVWTLPKL